MIIQVRLFAAARQLCDATTVEIELPAGSTVGNLREVLAKQKPAIAPLAPHFLFAVANDYVGDSFTLTEDLPVACIPPVSGG